MKSNSEVPVTSLSSSAYIALFGNQEIASDEVIIDIGSGESRLGAVVPDGSMIQVDPTYDSTLENHDNMSFAAIGLGKPAIIKSPAFRNLVRAEPTRVTTAHMLHHLSGERKLVAVEQILHLARDGIAQFYPVYSRRPRGLIATAEGRGVELSITRPPIRKVGQLSFTLVGINHTLNVLRQPERMTHRDRTKLAELILPAIV